MFWLIIHDRLRQSEQAGYCRYTLSSPAKKPRLTVSRIKVQIRTPFTCHTSSRTSNIDKAFLMILRVHRCFLAHHHCDQNSVSNTVLFPAKGECINDHQVTHHQPHTNTKITTFWMHNLNTVEKERKKLPAPCRCEQFPR